MVVHEIFEHNKKIRKDFEEEDVLSEASQDQINLQISKSPLLIAPSLNEIQHNHLIRL